MKILCGISGHSSNNFVYTHDSHTHPKVIRKHQNGNMSLMDVTSRDICFCVTDKAVNVHDVFK